MPEYIINIFTHPLFGLATGLVGFLIGHRLQLGRDRIGRFNAAAQKFRDAFKEEYFYFSPAVKGFIFFSNIISAAEPRHRMAYNDFILHLPRMRQRGFTKVWQEYNDCINAYEENTTVDKKRQAVSDIYNSMHKLLSYAKPK